MYLHTKALVLRETAYKESDKMLTLLTQEAGRLDCSARGCRRQGSPLAAGCQLLVWSDMVLSQHRGRWTVKELAVDREFRGVREDLTRFALGCYLAQVTETLAVEGLPSRELLALLLNSLHALDRLPYPAQQVKAAFELRVLSLSGYQPWLEDCPQCGARQPEQPRFHLRDGALHCAGCPMGEGESLPLTPGVLAAMRHIVYGDPKRLFSFHLDQEGLALLGQVCQAYLLTQLERGFSTLDFYQSLVIYPAHS